MSADLVARLRHGCVMHPRRWSGDTHDDLGGSIREAETDALMAEAAELIDTLRAQLEAAEADAARWRHARRLLAVEDVENAQAVYESFGRLVNEEECARADAAIDAARTKEQQA